MAGSILYLSPQYVRPTGADVHVLKESPVADRRLSDILSIYRYVSIDQPNSFLWAVSVTVVRSIGRGL